MGRLIQMTKYLSTQEEKKKKKQPVTIFSNAYKCGKIIRLWNDSLHSEKSCTPRTHVHIKGNIQTGKNQ